MHGDADPAVITLSRQSTSLAVLSRELRPRERVLVVAEAARRRFSLGILAATSDRVIFAQSRLLRSDVMLSWEYDQIREVQIGDDPLSGKLSLTTDTAVAAFDLIRPRERTHLLLWRIRERIGDLPPGRHS